MNLNDRILYTPDSELTNIKQIQHEASSHIALANMLLHDNSGELLRNKKIEYFGSDNSIPDPSIKDFIEFVKANPGEVSDSDKALSQQYIESVYMGSTPEFYTNAIEKLDLTNFSPEQLENYKMAILTQAYEAEGMIKTDGLEESFCLERCQYALEKDGGFINANREHETKKEIQLQKFMLGANWIIDGTNDIPIDPALPARLAQQFQHSATIKAILEKNDVHTNYVVNKAVDYAKQKKSNSLFAKDYKGQSVTSEEVCNILFDPRNNDLFYKEKSPVYAKIEMLTEQYQVLRESQGYSQSNARILAAADVYRDQYRNQLDNSYKKYLPENIPENLSEIDKVTAVVFGTGGAVINFERDSLETFRVNSLQAVFPAQQRDNNFLNNILKSINSSIKPVLNPMKSLIDRFNKNLTHIIKSSVEVSKSAFEKLSPYNRFQKNQMFDNGLVSKPKYNSTLEKLKQILEKEGITSYNPTSLEKLAEEIVTNNDLHSLESNDSKILDKLNSSDLTLDLMTSQESALIKSMSLENSAIKQTEAIVKEAVNLIKDSFTEPDFVNDKNQRAEIAR